MYYCSLTNNYINDGFEFTIGDVTYPYIWISQATDEQKAELGINPVVAINSPADERYYWVGTSYNGAELTFINTPKDLDYLKTTFTSQIKQQVYGLLQPTDYIDIRNMRDPNYKIDWMVWRDQVRAYSAELIQNISLAEDVDSVKSILDGLAWPHDPNYVAPVQSPDSGEVGSIPS
jgi:hypothetical protein